MKRESSAQSITIKAFAKINLSIDVLGKRPDGMHEVDMVMQALDYHDLVTVTEEAPGAGTPAGPDGSSPGAGAEILITCDRAEVPTDRSNICWKAAELMRALRAEADRGAGILHIDIQKRIPVAAGMAGGSTDGAAVLHALNILWDMGLDTEELMELGGKLGADVPFCVLAQAADLDDGAAEDPSAGSPAARARGTGTLISTVTPLSGYVTFAKPPIGVSTKEVYKGIDSCEIERRPDNDLLEAALREAAGQRGQAGQAAAQRGQAAAQAAGSSAQRAAVTEQMINVLELYTLRAEPLVAELKSLMERELPEAEKILMSGSGPTVFALFGEDEREKAERARDLLRAAGYEAHFAALMK